MTSPFDDDNARCVVLLNDEGQYSLWPASLTVPGGWRDVFESDTNGCREYVTTHWTDMRPKSLKARLET